MAGKEEPTGLNGLIVSYDPTYDHQIFSKNGKEVYRIDSRGVVRPHVNINFAAHTVTGVSDSGLVTATGTAGIGTGDLLNYLHCQNGQKLCWEAIVTQTILPDIVAAGLDVAGDQTANDGMELYGNMLGATGVPFVPGLDPAFFFRCKFTGTANDGTDDFQLGFRQNELCRPAFDDYRNAATLGCNTAAEPMAIKIASILANASTVETDTTDTLATTVQAEWQVNVAADGAVTYLIDGAAPTATAAVTLTNGIGYVPFFRFLQHSTLWEVVTIQEWECGFQAPA